MKKFIIIAITILIVTPACLFLLLEVTPQPLFWLIQSKAQIKEENFPKPDNYSEIEAKVDKTENLSYSEEFNNSSLDLYQPKGVSNQKLPVMVFIHGGGFFIGDKKMSQYFAQSIAAEGYAVLNINYDLVPNLTVMEQIKQVNEIFTFITNNADKFNLDSKQINLSGSSAGGFLALALALAYNNNDYAKELNLQINQNINIQSIILYSAVFNLAPFQNLKMQFPMSYIFSKLGWGLTGIKNWQNDKTLSNLLDLNNFITSDLPPIFITDGNTKTFTSQAYSTVKELKEKNVSVDTLFFPDTQKVGHGYQLKMNTEAAQTAFVKTVEFLKKNN